jgi:hypothetical protein
MAFKVMSPVLSVISNVVISKVVIYKVIICIVIVFCGNTISTAQLVKSVSYSCKLFYDFGH